MVSIYEYIGAITQNLSMFPQSFNSSSYDSSAIPLLLTGDGNKEGGKTCVFTYVSFVVAAGYILCTLLASIILYKLLQTSRRRPQKLFLFIITTQTFMRFLFFFLWPLHVLSKSCAPGTNSASIFLDILGTIPVCMFITAFSLYVLTFARVHQLFQLHYNRWSTTCIVTFYRLLVISIFALNVLSYSTTIAELVTPSHSKVYDIVEQSSVYFISFGILVVAFSFVFIIRSLFNTIGEYIEMKQRQAAEEEGLFYEYHADPTSSSSSFLQTNGGPGNTGNNQTSAYIAPTLIHANPIDIDDDHVVFSSHNDLPVSNFSRAHNHPYGMERGQTNSPYHPSIQYGLEPPPVQQRKNSGSSTDRKQQHHGPGSFKGAITPIQDDGRTTPLDTFTMTVSGDNHHHYIDSSDEDGSSAEDAGIGHGNDHDGAKNDSFANPFDPKPMFSLPKFDTSVVKNLLSIGGGSSSSSPYDDSTTTSVPTQPQTQSQSQSQSRIGSMGDHNELTTIPDNDGHPIAPTHDVSPVVHGDDPHQNHLSNKQTTSNTPSDHNPLRRLLFVAFINCFSLTVKAVFLPVFVLIFHLSIPPIIIGFYYYLTEILPTLAMLLTFNVASASTNQWSTTYTDDGSFGYHEAVLSLIQSRREEQRQRQLLLNSEVSESSTSQDYHASINNSHVHHNHYEGGGSTGRSSNSGSRRSSLTGVGNDNDADRTSFTSHGGIPITSTRQSKQQQQQQQKQQLTDTPRKNRKPANGSFTFTTHTPNGGYDGYSDGSSVDDGMPSTSLMGTSPSMSRVHQSHISAFPAAPSAAPPPSSQHQRQRKQPSRLASPSAPSSLYSHSRPSSMATSYSQQPPQHLPPIALNRASSKRSSIGVGVGVGSQPVYGGLHDHHTNQHPHQPYAMSHVDLSTSTDPTSPRGGGGGGMEQVSNAIPSRVGLTSGLKRTTPIKNRNSLLLQPNRNADALITTAVPLPQSPQTQQDDMNDEYNLFFGPK